MLCRDSASLGSARPPIAGPVALLRLQSALPLLAGGEVVGRIAYRVGYETPSAFVAAFRREIGVTPAAYFGRT